MQNRQTIAAGVVLIFAVFGVFTISETGRYSTCSGGEWQALNETHHACTANARSAVCARVSGSRCYLGEVTGFEESAVEPERAHYHCYPDKGYCYKDGNINNPRVPISEVIG